MTISPADVILILFGFFFYSEYYITPIQSSGSGMRYSSKYKPYFIPFTVIWAIMRPRRDPSRTYGVD